MAPFNSDESSEVKPKFKTRRDYIKSRNAAKSKSKQRASDDENPDTE